MKRGTFDHPKFKALMQELNLKRFEATGILETLWHFTAQYARLGDVGRWSNEQIADSCGWPKESADGLVAALINTGWLDPVDGPDRLLVHDWPEHCDDATHMAVARSKSCFANGLQPKLGRLPPNERERLVQYFKENPCSRRAHGVATACSRRVVSPPPPAISISKPIINTLVEKSGQSEPEELKLFGENESQPPPCNEFQAAWNALGKPFSKVLVFNQARKSAFAVRWREPFFRENWRKGLERMRKSQFCRGGGPRKWIADIEFFLRPTSLVSLLEGKYDRTSNGDSRLPMLLNENETALDEEGNF